MSILTSDHIAGWYLLRKKAVNIFDQDIQPYFLLGEPTNTTSTSFSAAQLIQGEAGNIVIDNNNIRLAYHKYQHYYHQHYYHYQ
jgi:hypothetical protein